MLPKKLETINFLKVSSSAEANPITILELTGLLEAHEGTFLIDDIEYDSSLYCGTDNLYFSYCFNYKTGRALTETLIIVESIVKISDKIYTITTNNKEVSVILKD